MTNNQIDATALYSYCEGFYCKGSDDKEVITYPTGNII